MHGIRKDVRDLISINERLQSALAQGDRLTEEERLIVRMCAAELLEKVPDQDHVVRIHHSSSSSSSSSDSSSVSN